MMQLSLSSAAGTIDLAALEKGASHGFQAQPGAMGFGAPERTIGWSERLGDGANVTQRRVMRRRLDVPIEILTDYASNPRAQLKSYHDLMLRILAGPCKLNAYLPDENKTFSLDCEPTNGGQATFGEDTDGKTFFSTVLVLEAADPYWKNTTPVTETYTFSTSTKAFSLSLPGNAPTPIKFTIDSGANFLNSCGYTDSAGNGVFYSFTQFGTGPSHGFVHDVEAGVTKIVNGEVTTVGFTRDLSRVGGFKRYPGGSVQSFTFAVNTVSPSVSRTVTASYAERRLGLL